MYINFCEIWLVVESSRGAVKIHVEFKYLQSDVLDGQVLHPLFFILIL